MSIATVTSRHTVTVLEPTEVQDRQMGRSRTYAPASPPRVLTCTVVPGAPAWVLDLLNQKGVKTPHSIYFAADPRVDERQRLRWEGVGNQTVLRIVVPKNAHGQNRLWIIYGGAATDDNLGLQME